MSDSNTTPISSPRRVLVTGAAKGIGIGSAAHAVGTAKALEMGEVEGAMSGLAIAVAGILTALLCPVVANLI